MKAKFGNYFGNKTDYDSVLRRLRKKLNLK